MISGGCSDQLLDSAPERPAPAAPAHAFAPTVGGVSFVGSVPVPGTNLIEQGKVPWTDLGQTFTEHGWVELRTSGEVSYNINWDAQYGSCGMYCIGVNASPGHGEGTTGAAGIPGGLRVKLTPALQNPGESYQGAGLVVTPDRQVYTLVEVGPGSRLWGGRSGISGVRGGIPWYFLGGMTSVEVRRVEPVQVQPNKTSFTRGEVLTWTTQLYPGVGDLYWRFQSPGHSDISVSCRNQTVCEWAPPRPGRMRVDGKWTAAWPGPLVYGYSPEVSVRQPQLSLNCMPSRVPSKGETTCEATVDMPASSFVVQSFSYSATSVPQGQNGDLKSWTFKPQAAGSGIVTVTATVNGQVLSATAQVEVCEFFKTPPADPTLLDPAVQAILMELAQLTNFQGPLSTRYENGGLIGRKNGRVEFLPSNAGPPDGCQFAYYDGEDTHYRNQDYEILGRVHSHPIAINGTRPNPGTCVKVPVTQAPYVQYRDRPSPADLANWQNGDNEYPGYLVDPRHVHRWERKSPSGGKPVQQTMDLNTGANRCIIASSV